MAKPLPGAQAALDHLFSNDNTIILWTARGWEQYKVTVQWLNDHNMKYHQLIMGKPMVDIFIDDRARQFTSWDDVAL